MTPKEFFGDWWRYIDPNAMNVALQYVQTAVKQGWTVYPDAKDVFKAFKLCPYNNVRVVLLGLDPYCIEGMATGLAFANPADTPDDRVSPSLRVLRDAAIDWTRHHNKVTFDLSLESWAKQGVLLLNSALTVLAHSPESHLLYWRPFISHFLESFSSDNPGTAYMLFGSRARGFKDKIKSGLVLETEHPAWYVRMHKDMPPKIFREVNDFLMQIEGYPIRWYEEETVEGDES